MARLRKQRKGHGQRGFSSSHYGVECGGKPIGHGTVRKWSSGLGDRGSFKDMEGSWCAVGWCGDDDIHDCGFETKGEAREALQHFAENRPCGSTDRVRRRRRR